jgi:transaldolase
VTEKTPQALATHDNIGRMMPCDDGDAEQVIKGFTEAGVDLDALAADLQREGVAAFAKSWDELLACIAHKSAQLKC